MGIITDMRRRLGLWTSSELRAEIAKANPALPSFISEATGGGEGQGPLDQNFQMYLESPGLFHTVSACVDAISNAWAAIPLKAMRRVGDGSEEIPRHSLLDILENPNPEQGDFSFRFGIGQQIGYTGEAIVTTDNENGFTRPLTPGRDELWIQRTDRMAPVINKDAVRVGSEVNPIDHWVYNGPGGRTRFAPERVIQVKRPHPTDPWRGLPR